VSPTAWDSRLRAPTIIVRARIGKNQTEDELARCLLFEKYTTEEKGLDEWARTALPIAFDLVSS
jgi:hypothetical protein